MPKRVPTPPPADDEPRYLTVVYPYAISGTCNMELPKDRQDFARWVACCIDKDAFFAIFHKPSSRAMVIIEVSRDYQHFDRILGEHRWSEFLQNPTAEEAGRVTQVFYCTYNTGRIVQKNGWKRIDVDDVWFKGLTPKNRHIKSPYPATHFCDVPVEDRTNLSMCRPLPGAVKQAPPPELIAPQPVVGSVAWIESKGGPLAALPVQTKPNPLGAWGKGAPKVQVTSAKPNPTAGGSVKKTIGVSQAPHPVARLPAVGGGSIAVKSSNVWQKPTKKPASAPVATNWEESPAVSRENTPVLRDVSPPVAPRGNPWGDYPSRPLGLTLPSKPTPSSVEGGPDGASNLHATGWDSAGGSTSSPDSDSGPDLTTATESDNPYAVHIHFSESMEEEFHGMRIQAMEEDDAELRGLDTMAPLGVWDEQVAEQTWGAVPMSWDDTPIDADSLQNQNAAEKPILCNAHGIICKKGICAEYAKQLRATKRAEEAEKRKVDAANRGKKGKGRGKKSGGKDAAGKEATNANPNPFRGPGAPVKTNWRGAPRAIVSADAVEKKESTKVVSDGGWANSDSEVELSVAPITLGGNWADEVDAEMAAREDDTITTASSSSKASRRQAKGTATNWDNDDATSSTGGWGNVSDMPW